DCCSVLPSPLTGPYGRGQSHMGSSPLFLSPMGRGRGPLRSNGKVRAAALSGLFSIEAPLTLPSPRRGEGNITVGVKEHHHLVKLTALPASTLRKLPVDFDDRSEAKKCTASAISSG